MSNGEWVIDDIQGFNETSGPSKCCGEYSIVKYKITLTRKPFYLMFYLSPPSIVLVVLAILSFFIPIESGERIGLVITVLLAFMVFLLMLPEYLPRTSDQLPTLGLWLIISMILIAWVLVVTIVELTCHHREGHPPVVIQKVFFPLRYRKTTNSDVESQGNETGRNEIQAWDRNGNNITWKNVARKFNFLSFCLTSVVALLTSIPLIARY